jgi:hypothetical protein
MVLTSLGNDYPVISYPIFRGNKIISYSPVANEIEVPQLSNLPIK